ncbi:MAG: peptidylprolyl isomerase [Aulosira sp. ZfuVER01]|nr:peptidylprolyl isomerase [Aulosira sp. ZfuVER01]MDZ7998256.1 peptidylprolyl isomerase [Aulosira sp. DedVER01a]MDZ8055500.1 peptidylprolyl isomerase [Aulosira sp. ZfuCHP01]
MLESLTKPSSISPATDTEILAYLRRVHKIADIAALAERDTLVLRACEEFKIKVTNEELQAAGDAFRLEHKLLGASETLNWLSQQRISVEDWSLGIKIELLTKKLKEYLFGMEVDADYMKNRDRYRQVILSQILVPDLSDALKIVHLIQKENASFAALAVEYSQDQLSLENGGFVGLCLLVELIPEIVQAITDAVAGQVIGPIPTKLGHHILRVEKWLHPELSNSARENILESLFQVWLHNSTAH